MGIDPASPRCDPFYEAMRKAGLPLISHAGEERAVRLLNGSDYPLPGVMPIFSVDYLVSLGLVEESAAPVLKEIRVHNPLLFDFVLKRHLRVGRTKAAAGKALSRSVFETRRFFAPP